MNLRDIFKISSNCHQTPHENTTWCFGEELTDNFPGLATMFGKDKNKKIIRI